VGCNSVLPGIAWYFEAGKCGTEGMTDKARRRHPEALINY
jgi:hypothetical protein